MQTWQRDALNSRATSTANRLMKSWSIAVLSGVIGIAVGSGITALTLVNLSTKKQLLFDQKQKCLQLADKWEKDQTTESVWRVGYSSKRNSCIIQSYWQFHIKDKNNELRQSIYIRDLLTEDTLDSVHCGDDCDKQFKDINKRFEAYL